MSHPADTSDPTAQAETPAPPADAASLRGRMERQLTVLGRLAEAGLNLALAIERQATTEGAAPVVAGDVALAYARVSRAVRLSVALQAKVIKDLQALDQAAASRLYGQTVNAERQRQRLAEQRQDRVQRIVERVIAAEVADAAEVDRLAEAASERLEHDDIYGDLAKRPVGEIIALICRDLDLSPDWTRLAAEAWAQEEIESGAAGSPFAALRGRDPPHAWADAEAAAGRQGPAERRAASP